MISSIRFNFVCVCVCEKAFITRTKKKRVGMFILIWGIIDFDNQKLEVLLALNSEHFTLCLVILVSKLLGLSHNSVMRTSYSFECQVMCRWRYPVGLSAIEIRYEVHSRDGLRPSSNCFPIQQFIYCFYYFIDF